MNVSKHIREMEREIERLRSFTPPRCEQCGGSVIDKRLDAAFCSDACRQAAYRQRVGLSR
jgi:hypothetical protein